MLLNFRPEVNIPGGALYCSALFSLFAAILFSFCDKNEKMLKNKIGPNGISVIRENLSFEDKF
jgi:hypothetical protein